MLIISQIKISEISQIYCIPFNTNPTRSDKYLCLGEEYTLDTFIRCLPPGHGKNYSLKEKKWINELRAKHARTYLGQCGVFSINFLLFFPPKSPAINYVQLHCFLENKLKILNCSIILFRGDPVENILRGVILLKIF